MVCAYKKIDLFECTNIIQEAKFKCLNANLYYEKFGVKKKRKKTKPQQFFASLLFNSLYTFICLRLSKLSVKLLFERHT